MIAPPDAPLGFADLPEEHRARVEAEMAPGERLIWAAQSGPRPDGYFPNPVVPTMFTSIGIIICFASLAGGFGLLGSDRFVDRSIYGVIGAVSAFGSLWAIALAWDAWTRRRNDRSEGRRSLYALTDRRAVIWSPLMDGAALDVFTIGANTLQAVHRVEYPDGRGEVRLGHYRKREENYSHSVPLGFIGVDAVRQVEGLTREVLVGVIAPTRSENVPLGDGLHYPFDSDEPEEPF